MIRSAIAILIVAGFLAPCPAEQPVQQRLKWWNDAKFGMFIHWGPYSLASVETSWPIMSPDPKWNITQAEYEALPERFNPVQYDPDAWVRLARDAGQRYMVFSSKLHDGFCMFDSSFTNYKITNTPYGNDTIAMLAAACRKHDLPLGFYYSPPDMRHPGFRDTSKLAKENWKGEPWRPEWPSYLEYMELQLTELLTRYGPVAVLWFDGLRDREKYNPRRFFKLVRELQPDTLINNRIGVPADFDTPEKFIPDGYPTKATAAQFANPRGSDAMAIGITKGGAYSKVPPPPEDFRPWETCMTINETWAYNKNDRNFKSPTVLIRMLVEVVSKGGNLLLDVGPTPEGTIQPEFQQRLREVGKWLKVNGEAIYGTTYGPLYDLPFGRSTAKGNTIYLHVFDWPQGKLEVNMRGRKAAQVKLLAGDKVLPFQQAQNTLVIDVPAQAPDPHASVVELELL